MNGDQAAQTEAGVNTPETSSSHPVTEVSTPPVDAAATSAAPTEPVAAPEAMASTAVPVPETPVPETPVPETPVPETPAPETPAPETLAPDAAAEGDAARPRVQLNPTANPAQLRAVPTYQSEGDGAPGSVGVGAAQAFMEGPKGPVDVPPKNAPLEADLEAELTAAMSGAMTAEASPSLPANVNPTEELPASEEQLEAGQRLKAKVQSVNAENVFCEVGYRAPGLLPVKQFPTGKHPNIGEEFLVVVDKFDTENGVILISLPKATRRARGNWEDLAVGQIVECVVNKTNKGGLEVTISNMRAFLPASQVDVGFVSSLDPYVGQRFAVQITEVNATKRNLVVSRRALVIQERKEAAATFWETADVGQQYAGKVKTIKDYGAFIDLGGVDGFLHIGEMSWTRIKHPSEVLQEGSPVDVVVLSLDREKQKIGLGMKQLAQNPWNTAGEKYPVGQTVTGRVTRTTDFGAFVELEVGVEGLVHISELDYRRVKRVTEVLNVGQEIQASVLEVEPDRQRISLSVKALKPKPEQPKDEDLSPSKGQAYERKRKEPLRGGTGGMGGGLFGNPTDFQ